jgi:hypothetical protein
MMNSKRGQNSTIGVTIAIVLGIALVVFLIWGFSTNWAIFSSTGGAYSGQTNIDSLRNACKTQCDAGFTAQYCSAVKNLIPPEGESRQGNCVSLGLQAYEGQDPDGCDNVVCGA